MWCEIVHGIIRGKHKVIEEGGFTLTYCPICDRTFGQQAIVDDAVAKQEAQKDVEVAE